MSAMPKHVCTCRHLRTVDVPCMTNGIGYVCNRGKDGIADASSVYDQWHCVFLCVRGTEGTADALSVYDQWHCMCIYIRDKEGLEDALSVYDQRHCMCIHQ